MNVGDQVRIVGIPPGLNDSDELRTRSLLEKCVGQVFEVTGLQSVEGLDFPFIGLDVGHMVGAQSWEHTIWIEPQYVELAESATRCGE